jgi:hypothetical protein
MWMWIVDLRRFNRNWLLIKAEDLLIVVSFMFVKALVSFKIFLFSYYFYVLLRHKYTILVGKPDVMWPLVWPRRKF